MHLVKWTTLNKRRKFRGLGIKSLQKMNKALLIKWHWRFATEKKVLWRDIVLKKYGAEPLDWFSKMPKITYGKSVWKGIMNCNTIFRSHVRFIVNSGSTDKFWMDN